MNRIPVDSAEISEIGYSVSSRTLEVLFRSGAIRLYYFVPESTHDSLMVAYDKAVYFDRHIRGIYESHQIVEPYDAAPGKKRLAVNR